MFGLGTMESIIAHIAVIVAFMIIFLPTIAVYCLATFIAVFRKHPKKSFDSLLPYSFTLC